MEGHIDRISSCKRKVAVGSMCDICSLSISNYESNPNVRYSSQALWEPMPTYTRVQTRTTPSDCTEVRSILNTIRTFTVNEFWKTEHLSIQYLMQDLNVWYNLTCRTHHSRISIYHQVCPVMVMKQIRNFTCCLHLTEPGNKVTCSETAALINSRMHHSDIRVIVQCKTYISSETLSCNEWLTKYSSDRWSCQTNKRYRYKCSQRNHISSSDDPQSHQKINEHSCSMRVMR